MIGEEFFEFDKQKQTDALSELVGLFISAAMMGNVQFAKVRRKDNGAEGRLCAIQIGEGGVAFPVEIVVCNPAEVYEFFNSSTEQWENLDSKADAEKVTVGEVLDSIAEGANHVKQQRGQPRYMRHFAGIHLAQSRQPVSYHAGISMYAASLEDTERFPELRGVELVAVWTEDGNFRCRTTTQEDVKRDIVEDANGEIVMGARG